jgi:hypothetical protein
MCLEEGNFYPKPVDYGFGGFFFFFFDFEGGNSFGGQLKKHGKINAVGEGTKPKVERERSARTQLQSPHDNFSLGCHTN